MTNFNPDPRVRDNEPDTTALGPNFPGSINDLWRMVFRPSQAFLRYVQLAVSNDDGSRLLENTDKRLDLLIASVEAGNVLLRELIDVTKESSDA